MKLSLFLVLAALTSIPAHAEPQLWGTCYVKDTYVQQKLGWHMIPGCDGSVYSFYRDEEANVNVITRNANLKCNSKAFSEEVSFSKLRTAYWVFKTAIGTICK